MYMRRTPESMRKEPAGSSDPKAASSASTSRESLNFSVFYFFFEMK